MKVIFIDGPAKGEVTEIDSWAGVQYLLEGENEPHTYRIYKFTLFGKLLRVGSICPDPNEISDNDFWDVMMSSKAKEALVERGPTAQATSAR